MGEALLYWRLVLDSARRSQVWLIHPHGDRDSGGLCTVDTQGGARVIIRAHAPCEQYSAIGITDEPWQGSHGPTGSRVFGGAIR